MQLAEIKSKKFFPLTPGQARFNYLKQQRERAANELKAELERKQPVKATEKIQPAST